MGESSRLYYEYYRFAFDTARRAEQTMKRELMRPELDSKTLIQFNYWDGGRKGLLSGESLGLDVRRMEMAYHEHNLREYSLTKHVSLLQLEPLSLVKLRATGRCTVRMPEELFDIDSPGHYFRRIKSVALSIPCVTGPYTAINCKLTLIKSSVRTSPTLNGGYPREGQEDARFQDYLGSLQSVVVSSGQQDTGLFESDTRDERYLPFENAGVISEWELELPANPSDDDPTTFDYDSIADAVLHLRYSARQGGAPLRAAALEQIKEQINAGIAAGVTRLFSVRHEFPTEWARFVGQVPANSQRYELALSLRQEHYPYWSQGRLNSVSRIDLIAVSSEDPSPSTISVADRLDRADAGTKKDAIPKDASQGGHFIGKLQSVPLPANPTAELKLYFDDAKLRDLWIGLTWSGVSGQ